MGEELTSLPSFELSEIIINGLLAPARPVAWDREMADGEGRDANGEFAIPTEYECTCPHCGNMVHFEAVFEALQCPECGVGQNVPIVQFAPPFQDPGEYGQVSDPIPDSAFGDAAIDPELLEAIEWLQNTKFDTISDEELDTMLEELEKDEIPEDSE